MKFINYLEKISGIGVFPLLSLLLFFIVFLLASFYAFQINKSEIDQMANIPLEDTNRNFNKL